MSTCVPVRDMKDTAAFTELVQSEDDVTVTKNGQDTMHCLSIREYRLLQEERAKARLLSRILVAEDEIKRAEGKDYRAFAQSIRDEYGL